MERRVEDVIDGLDHLPPAMVGAHEPNDGLLAILPAGDDDSAEVVVPVADPGGPTAAVVGAVRRLAVGASRAGPPARAGRADLATGALAIGRNICDGPRPPRRIAAPGQQRIQQPAPCSAGRTRHTAGDEARANHYGYCCWPSGPGAICGTGFVSVTISFQ